nr:MAG TPA: hypothetical protein [Caudoviricetes sp.]
MNKNSIIKNIIFNLLLTANPKNKIHIQILLTT